MAKKENNKNIKEKLLKIRRELQEKELKKSGENSYAGYKYFTLGNLIPPISELMEKYKVLSKIDFTEKTATLVLYDLEGEGEEGQIRFQTPMASADLKGCHEVQNLGAAQTYLRRYLYLTAFQVVEEDILDKTTEKTAERRKKKDEAPSDKQINYLKQLYKKKNGKKMPKEKLLDIQSLSREKASDLIEKWKSEIEKEEE